MSPTGCVLGILSGFLSQEVVFLIQIVCLCIVLDLLSHSGDIADGIGKRTGIYFFTAASASGVAPVTTAEFRCARTASDKFLRYVLNRFCTSERFKMS